MASLDRTPPSARLREINFEARDQLPALANDPPPPVALESDAGSSGAFARADHTHGSIDGFNPSNRVNDGLYFTATTPSQDPDLGNTEWSVPFTDGRVIIDHHVSRLVGDTCTIHSGSNLLPAPGDKCIAAVVVHVEMGGTVMTAGDSWMWCTSSLDMRGPPKKASRTTRAV